MPMEKERIPDNAAHNQLVASVLSILQRAAHYFWKCQDKECRKVGITGEQLAMLTAIAAAERSVKATDLAQWIGKSKFAISLSVDRMVKEGMIERLVDQPDRRSTLLSLTVKGRDKLGLGARPVLDLSERLLSNFTEEELKTFVCLLRKFEKETVVELQGKEQPLSDWAIGRIQSLWRKMGAI